MAKTYAEKYSERWIKTSYNEFSKRMFICFMIAFFAHILLTILAEVFTESYGKALEVIRVCIPVYTTIFAAVIVKGGVENIYKGKMVADAIKKEEENG